MKLKNKISGASFDYKIMHDLFCGKNNIPCVSQRDQPLRMMDGSLQGNFAPPRAVHSKGPIKTVKGC